MEETKPAEHLEEEVASVVPEEETIDVDPMAVRRVVRVVLVDGDVLEHIATQFALSFPREAREGHWFEALYLKSVDKTLVKLDWEVIELFTPEELFEGYEFVEYDEKLDGISMDTIEYLEQDFGIS